MIPTASGNPTVKRNGEVWLDGKRIGEVVDNGFTLSSLRRGKVWQYRARPWHRWAGNGDTRREAVSDLLKLTSSPTKP